ncbi:L2 [Boa constrictor papillomavirus 1]|uniref:L2 n=1 Tax=Boa constrictor papillomavirus 1 TaxID=2294156 RepID=UPI000E3338B2|nr:L2 [Boa constrictor papillomavirus 1]AXL96276.1 L2 [Boa constrictor papillomavirus 1]
MEPPVVLRRRKRASVGDIYKTCKHYGNCPTDVINKVESNTLADKIIKYGSVGVYLGGLGIGTGSGGGGSGGYKPLTEGAGVNIGAATTVVRPSIPVDVGAGEVIPLGTIDAAEPEIIPLEEGPIDIEGGPIETIAEVHPTPEISVNGSDSVVINVHSTTHIENPVFDAPHVLGTGETSISTNVFVDVGPMNVVPITEAIELQEIDLDPFPELEIDDIPRTSTPSLAQRIRNVARFYRRGTPQVNVQAPEFLNRPGSLVTFENPAFAPDVTLEFAQDLAELASAAPDPAFTDIVSLSRPTIEEVGGRVRVSRLGTQGTVRTRSGAQIGGTVHYFQDLSTINAPVEFELEVIGEEPGEATIISSDSPSVIGGIEEVPFEEPAITRARSTRRNVLLSRLGREALRFVAQRVGSSFYTVPEYIPYEDEGKAFINVNMDPIPTYIVHDLNSSGTYSLHPSLLRRRKRKRSF